MVRSITAPAIVIYKPFEDYSHVIHSPGVRIEFSLEIAVSGASGLHMSYLEID
jgi:hypothetical protein